MKKERQVLANVYGYEVSGKTGTSQYYDDEIKILILSSRLFVASNKNYILLVMLDDPQVAKTLLMIIGV